MNCDNNQSFNYEYFAKLTEKRRKKAEEKHDPEYAAMWENSIDIYSDSAHFVYELLQNADDAGATEAEFILDNTKVIFKHNGTRQFTISDPDSKSIEKDRNENKYGDINAITAIGFSNKRIDDNTNKIGKFGVGFMAVFSYTQSPNIYDDNIWFKIEDHIIPIRLDVDCPERKKGETAFVLTFDNPKTKKNAFEEISEKLKHLENPVLFLTNLKHVRYRINNNIGEYANGSTSGKYEAQVVETKDVDSQTNANLIHVYHNDKNEHDTIWILSRGIERYLKYSVGFWVDDDNNFITNKNDYAYCYFSTKEVTNLNFVIHAPFELTQNRSNIKAGVKHNQEMIQLLAELAGDALIFFRDISTKEHHYINDRIFDLVPLNDSSFKEVGNSESISFKPFYTEIRKRFEVEELLPGKGHCVSKEHAYWANVASIMSLFSNEQLKQITGDNNAEWVLSEIGRDSKQGIKIRDYVDGLINKYFDEEIQNRNILYSLSKEFIEAQTFDWLLIFYKWCVETNNRRNIAQKRPIFINHLGNATPLLNQSNVPILFIPVPHMIGLNFVHDDFIKDDDCREIFEDKFQIRKPNTFDYIRTTIIPKYTFPHLVESHELDTVIDDFKVIFRCYISEITPDKEKQFLSLIRECNIILYNHGNTFYCTKANELYLPDTNLNEYLNHLDKYNIIDINRYIKWLNEELNNCSEVRDKLRDFFISLGARTVLQFWKINYKGYDGERQYKQMRDLYYYNNLIPSCESALYNRQRDEWTIYCVETLREFVKLIVNEHSVEMSLLLWKILATSIMSVKQLGKAICEYRYFYRTDRSYKFYSPDYYLLMIEKWLVNKNGEFISVSNNLSSLTHYAYPNLGCSIFREDLCVDYDMDIEGASELCDLLGKV